MTISPSRSGDALFAVALPKVPTMAKRFATHARHVGRGALVFVVFLAAIGLVVTGSLMLYFPTKTTQNEVDEWGDTENPNRVNITVWLTRVDPAGSTIAVTITYVQPVGDLADDKGFFKDDANLYSLTSLQNVTTVIKKGDDVPSVEQRYTVSGYVTDYPFDRYTSSLEFHAWGGPDGETELPLDVTFYGTDSFFAVNSAPGPSVNNTGVDLEISMRRSTPTLVYATFVMVLMLGLAVAAATAGYYAIRRKKGLLFPACSMMAAMLFALIPLRNAVPGSPPIGSVIDFGSFFIATIIIAVTLITTVIVGYRVQLRKDREDDDHDDVVEELAILELEEARFRAAGKPDSPDRP
jgi:hypothetical protein